MRILVFGAGGVGGYFGGRWADADLDVTLIARGAHLEAMRSRGLTIRSPLGDATVKVMATHDPAEVGEVDAVIVATKTWQLPEAVTALAPLLGDETVVVGLQNGVDAAATIAGEIGGRHVIGGSCRIISYIEEPGVIRHVGADPVLLFGELGGGYSARVQRLFNALSDTPGMSVTASDDIQTVIWKKFHFLAATAGVGSVTQAPLGVIRSTPDVRELLRAAMDEILALAHARGVDLDELLTDEALAFVDELPADGTSSMQRDFADGKRSELESLSGAVVRLGRKDGVETPVHGFLYAALLPREIEAQTAYKEKK